MKKRNKVLSIIALMMGLIGTMAVPAAAAGTSSIAPVAATGAIPTDGTGTVIENSTDTPEKREFFTIKTAAGNVFYIVVDKQKTSDNVYLLTPVTESDLARLAGSKTADTITGNTVSGQTVVGSSPVSQAPAASSQPVVSQAPKTFAAAKAVTGAKTPPSGGNAGAVTIAVFAILIVGGVGFYFKIYKPRHEVSDTEDDMEEKSQDAEADTFDQSESGEDNSDGSDSGDGNGDE
ncbi:MAG: DUF4366 domain-containing protein [Oscillospiraceae bacterium]|jgi:hypothetical protein|nr:DUF4366 domain-containing protein [Oscillospiraceae bacterium]MCI2036168.1 DUF4366 domain-containing protein [Oscillospiraceae bacterium]